jgi:LPXTG-motif cell wall-anchored protein
MKNKFALAAVVMATAALASATLITTPANAVGFTPNPFTAAGVSWVDVPVADRIYLQPDETAGLYDDTSFGEIPAGITCDGGNIVGPALVATGLSCVDGSSAAFEPTKIEFGFGINFYGNTVSGGWPNSNASFTFDRAVTNFNDSIARITGKRTTAGLYLGAIDLDYLSSVSNLWIARTTVDGYPAFVVAWENFPGRGQPASGGLLSVQAVIMDLGDGDFNAYLNTSEFSMEDGDYGYNRANFLAALAKANGTNVITVNTVAGFPDSPTCQEVGSEIFSKLGTSDLTAFDDTTIYAKLLSAPDKTLSLFSDSSCSTPLNVPAKDVGDYALLRMEGDDAMPFGWGSYDVTTGYIGVVELFANSDFRALGNEGATPLINFSYNTTVPGRVLLGLRDAQVETAAQEDVTSPSSVALPNTGISVEPWMIGAGLGLAAAGAVFASGMLRARRRGRHSA